MHWAITCLTSLLSEATKDDGTCLGIDRGSPELESSKAFFGISHMAALFDHTHFQLNFEVSKLANWALSAKSAKHTPLEKYPLYGSDLVSCSLVGQICEMPGK